MKMFLDFLPVVLFFLTYKFSPELSQLLEPHLSAEHVVWLKEQSGFVLATLVLIPATLIPLAYTWFTEKVVHKMHLITFFIVLILGSLTVYLNDNNFVMWKPTIVQWGFALAFFVSLFMKKNALQHMLSAEISLPDAIWKNLTILWIIFFVFSGALNLYVKSHFSEDVWVDYKLFGIMGITIIFIIIQGIYISRHISDNPADSLADNDANTQSSD